MGKQQPTGSATMTTPYSLTILPNPILREVAQPIARIDDDIRNQAARMTETMIAAEGIGLAANQVGLLNRMVIVDMARRENQSRGSTASEPVVMINPEIVSRSEDTWVWNEGCLSIPQYYAEVERPFRVVVRYMGLDGQWHEREAEGLSSSCVQHEIDHLNGVLFIDYLSRLRRNLVIKKFEKLARERGTVL